MTRAGALAGALALVFVFLPAAASAHALDEYVQAARLSLSQQEVRLDMDLTPGAAVAADIIARIDVDRNGVISPQEAAAYGARVLADIALELDGRRVAMALARVDVPSAGEMGEGLGTIRLTAIGAHHVRLSSRAALAFRNDHAPEISVYAVNAMVPADRSLTVLGQDRDVFQRSVLVSYDVRPGVARQAGWTIFGVGSCLMIALMRRRSRFLIA